MRVLTALLWTLFVVLQYQLWFGQHGIRQLFITQSHIELQQIKNEKTLLQNKKLTKLVVSLQENTSTSIEGYARDTIGMIRQGETFYFMPRKK